MILLLKIKRIQVDEGKSQSVAVVDGAAEDLFQRVVEHRATSSSAAVRPGGWIPASVEVAVLTGPVW